MRRYVPRAKQAPDARGLLRNRQLLSPLAMPSRWGEVSFAFRQALSIASATSFPRPMVFLYSTT